LTANLKPLERRGLLTIAVDDTDRRSRRLVLTSKGRALLADAVPIWRREHAVVDASLGDSSPERLRGDLAALAAVDIAPTRGATPRRASARTGRGSSRR
jgi:DNA-binding MarR family transcriptional regulator